ESLLAALGDYQRHAAAAGFRVSVAAVTCWQRYQLVALQAEAELGRLGLSGHPQEPLAVGGEQKDYPGVLGLREHLLEARGKDGHGWGENLVPDYERILKGELPASGWWAAVRVGATELPDLSRPLATLREVVGDLRAAAARRSEGTPAGEETATAPVGSG